MHPQSSPLPSVPGLMVAGLSPSPTTSYAMPSPPVAPLQLTTATVHSSKSDGGVRLPSINETLGDLLHPSSASSASDRYHHHPQYLHFATFMAEPRISSVGTSRALTPSSPHLHGSLSSLSVSSDVSGCSHCHHCSSTADTAVINNSTAATTATSPITQSPLTHPHRQVTLSMSSPKNGTAVTPSSMITYTDGYRHMHQLPTPSPPSPIVADSPLSPSSQSRLTLNATVALPTNSSTGAEHTNYHQSTHATAAAPTPTPTATTSASGVTFVANSGVTHKKRPRRRPEEIERLYTCIYPGCTKAYGTLNHLNAHVAMQRHGAKRLPSEFETIRKQYRAMKLQQLQQRTMAQSVTSMHL
jgi:hypothetical protein